MINNTIAQTKSLYEMKFGETDLFISTNSSIEFVEFFTKMKNELIESFNGKNHDLFFSNINRFGSAGPCLSSVSNKIDELNFVIDIHNIRGNNKVCSVNISLEDNPFKSVLSLSDFLCAFFTMYFSSRSTTEEMMDIFCMYGNLPINKDILVLEKGSDVNLKQLEHFVGNYSIEVTYSLYLVNDVEQRFIVQHKDKKEREEFLNYLISRKRTHKVTVRPIKNTLLHSFVSKN